LRNPAEQQSWERLQRPRLTQLWTGFFDIGLSLARGNARTDTLTTSMTASRVTRNDKLSLYFNQIRGTARVDGVSSTIASAIRGGWSYNRDVTPRIFLTVLNDYEHDAFQDLDLRFVLGGGVGVNAIKTDRTNLSFLGSADYSRENFIDGVSRNSAEANFGEDLLMKLSTATTVMQTFRIFPNLSNTGDYRMNFDVSAAMALNKWLAWHVTGSDRYLSNPLFGRQRNDLLLSTGLRLSFTK
jgi:putative salt-induced outer membrane protein YdiY